MSWLEAVFLGLVQGLTEFLPVSSSGHLIMAQALLGIREEGILFEVALHVATLASVVIFYRRRIAELIAGTLRLAPDALGYVAKLALATVPAVAVALLLGDAIEAQFDSQVSVGFCLLFTGAVLASTRRTVQTASLPEPGFLAALLIGCAQAAALLPGVSRSGMTVAAALALGVAPVAAAEFSFLMGVIAVTGAAVRILPELSAVDPERLGPLLAGSGVALVSGVAAIWLFVRLLRTQGFHRFAFYCFAVGAFFLGWLALRA